MLNTTQATNGAHHPHAYESGEGGTAVEQALPRNVAVGASCPSPTQTLASPFSGTYNAPALFNRSVNCLEESQSP